MKRQEKNLQMRQKIIDYACQEFSEKSYVEASLNAICSAGNISKGIIYHYFKDKDALYLACVQVCFDTMTEYLDKNLIINDVAIESALTSYFAARIAFFAEKPSYLGVFYSAIITPPAHLLSTIDRITADFDAQALAILTSMLKSVNLREDVSIEEVVDVFRDYQDFVNARFQIKSPDESSLKEHEFRCLRSLKILLYGVIEREGGV